MEPTFGERLTSWLKFVGLRQTDLARALDVSRRAVHGWMHDHSAPTTDRLGPICTTLGVTQAEFFARMPVEDAALNAAREAKLAVEPDFGEHPGTGDITREVDMNRVLEGRKGEAA